MILTYIKMLFYKALHQDEEVEKLFDSVAVEASPYYRFYLDLFGKEVVEEGEEENSNTEPVSTPTTDEEKREEDE